MEVKTRSIGKEGVSGKYQITTREHNIIVVPKVIPIELFLDLVPSSLADNVTPCALVDFFMTDENACKISTLSCPRELSGSRDGAVVRAHASHV